MIDLALAVVDGVLDPDNGIDLTYAFIVGLPALVAAVASLYSIHTSRNFRERQRKDSGEILYEVKNDHRSNLRDDIDAIKAAVDHGFKELHKDVRELREELRTERIERIEGDKR